MSLVVEQLLKHKRLQSLILGTTVDSLIGDTELKGIKIKKEDGGSITDLELDGMFVAIGLIPQNEPFKNVVTLNNWGYVDSAEDCLTTSKGIFVAGDCRSKRIRQVATAAADGAVAALAACDYVDSLK